MIIATIQARMGSTRLPGKMLMLINGVPLVLHIYKRIRASKLIDTVIVCTSVEKKDDPLARFCKENNLPFHRGSEDDVYQRHLGAALENNADALIRVCGDCPLIDVIVIEKAIKEFTKQSVDYASNRYPKTYPVGFEFEIYRTSVLKEILEKEAGFFHRYPFEYIIKNPQKFKIVNIADNLKDNLTSIQLTVDYPQDLPFNEKILKKIDLQKNTLCEIKRLLKSEPQIFQRTKQEEELKRGFEFNDAKKEFENKLPPVTQSLYNKKSPENCKMEQNIKVKIGHRYVGEGEPCYIVFEGGGTHTGIESAKKFIDMTANAGADAIKFQYVNSDRLYRNKNIQISYKTTQGQKTSNRYEISKKRMLTPDEWKELIAYCRARGVTFFSTACFPEDVDFLVEHGTAAIKINSGDSNHHFLIDYASKKGVPIIFDGRASFGEIDEAINICEKNGNRNIILLHCPSGYPADDDAVNLRVIEAARKIYPYPIGYSDHSFGKLMNYPALVLGAVMIEKNITLDKTTDSVEHFQSLEPEEAKEFVKEIRLIEKALGSAREIFYTNMDPGARRSIVAKNTIPKGKIIDIHDFDFKRPGTHIPASHYPKMLNKRARREIGVDEPINLEDLE